LCSASATPSDGSAITTVTFEEKAGKTFDQLEELLAALGADSISPART
jgi:hypothetical protein